MINTTGFKKAISFVLVMTLILGSFAFSFAETVSGNTGNGSLSAAVTATTGAATTAPAVEETKGVVGIVVPSDVKGLPCADAVTALCTIGIVNGNPDGTYKPNETLNRAEAAKLIISAVGMGKYVNSSMKTSFNDIDGYSWAAPYIGYAEQMNIIKGVGHGKFNPGGAVSYEQFVTMLLRALGYTDESIPGDWPVSYITKAKSLGIFDKLDVERTKSANRGNVAMLLYNTLTIPMGYVNANNEWSPNPGMDGEAADTMLSRVGFKTIKAPDGKDFKMVLSDLPRDAKGEILRYAEGYNFCDQYGAYVIPFLDQDGQLFGVAKTISTFVTGEFTSKAGILDAFKTSDGKEYKIRQSVFNDIVRLDNNQLTGNISLSAINAEGEITLGAEINGNTITEIYSANFWNGKDYTWTAQDSSTIQKKKMLSGKRMFPLDNNDNIDRSQYILNGVATLGSIKANDIATLYMGRDGKTITRLDVSQKTVKGEVTRYYEKKHKVTIGGKDYEFNDAPITGGKYPAEWVSANGTFYLNYKGQIVNFKGKVKDSDYALIINAATTYKAIELDEDQPFGYQMKIMNDAGTKKVIDISNKATVTSGSSVYNIGVPGVLDMLTVNKLIAYSLSKDKKTITSIVIPELKLVTGQKYYENGYIGVDEIGSDSKVFVGTKSSNWSVKKYTTFFTKNEEIETPEFYAVIRDDEITAMRSIYPITKTTYGYAVDWEVNDSRDAYMLKLIYEGANRTLYTEDKKSALDPVLADSKFPLLKFAYSGDTLISATKITQPAISTVTSIDYDKKIIKTEGGWLDLATSCKYYEIDISDTKLDDDGSYEWTMKVSKIGEIQEGDFIYCFDSDTKKDGCEIVTFSHDDIRPSAPATPPVVPVEP